MISCRVSKNIWLIGIIAVAMAACTAFAWGSAYAETAPVSIGQQGYDTLKAAVEASDSGDVITLNESIDLTETVAIEGKRITIDLNTHNITGEISLAINVKMGTLIIEGKGEIKADTPIYLNSASNLEVKGNNPGVIKLTGSDEEGNNYAVDCDETSHTITIKNASLVGYEGLNIVCDNGTTDLKLTNTDIDAEEYGIYAGANSAVTITGGTVKAGRIPLFVGPKTQNIKTSDRPKFELKNDPKYDSEEWSADRFAYKELLDDDSPYSGTICGAFFGPVCSQNGREHFIAKGSLFRDKEDLKSDSYLEEGTSLWSNPDNETNERYGYVTDSGKKLTIHWSSLDGLDLTDPKVIGDIGPGTTVAQALEKEGLSTYELARYFLIESGQNSKYYPAEVLTNQPITAYSSDEDAAGDAAGNTLVTEDTHIYFHELKKVPKLEITVVQPDCGTEVKVENGSVYNQDPVPEVSVPEDADYELLTAPELGDHKALWVKWDEEGSEPTPYSGKMTDVNDATYRVQVKPAATNFGWTVMDVEPTVIGGQANKWVDSNFPYVTMDVSPVHVPGEWSAITKATRDTDGEMERSCPGCNCKETDTIHHPETIALATGSFVYNGQEQKPEVTVTYKDGEETKAIDPENYEVVYADNENAGTGTATVTFRSDRYEIEPVALTFEIAKAANTMTVKGKTVKVSKTKVKKKAQTIKVTKAFTVKGNNGKVTYKKKSGNKKITVSKAGKVTVKKGLKKGTYKVKVNVTAAGDANHNKVTKPATMTIKVR